MGFRVIYTIAMGREDGQAWSGFYAWARLGYQMALGDNNKFLTLMESWGRLEKTVAALLASPNGRQFWLDNGFTWFGEFLLQGETQSMLTLRSYLAEKSFDYDI